MEENGNEYGLPNFINRPLLVAKISEFLQSETGSVEMFTVGGRFRKFKTNNVETQDNVVLITDKIYYEVWEENDFICIKKFKDGFEHTTAIPINSIEFIEYNKNTTHYDHYSSEQEMIEFLKGVSVGDDLVVNMSKRQDDYGKYQYRGTFKEHTVETVKTEGREGFTRFRIILQLNENCIDADDGCQNIDGTIEISSYAIYSIDYLKG